MDQKNYYGKEKSRENEILYSKSVKAGKRIYYIDVKRDRKDELYLSLTESKRIKDQDLDAPPVFEKHKIFLYREDLDKFQHAFEEAAAFTRENAPDNSYAPDWYGSSEDYEQDYHSEKDYKIDIDF